MYASLVNMFKTLKWVFQKMKFLPEPGLKICPMTGSAPYALLIRMSLKK
jgi:hypothetical protein